MNIKKMAFQALLVALPFLYSPSVLAQVLIESCRDLAGFNDKGFIIHDGVPVTAIATCESAIKAFPQNTDLPAYLSRAYYTNGRQSEAYLPAKQSAEAGSSTGMAALGMTFSAGYGVAMDAVQSAYWNRKAAEQGNARGQDNLGVNYKQGKGVEKDAVQAVFWFRKAADQGYDNAQNNLGVMYDHGTGVEKDAVQAVTWYRKAAEQGNADGQTNLGLMYSNGTGVAKDAVQAVSWYRKAAEQGNASGQTNLGFMYSRGTGVEKDAVQAVTWYRKAAEQGDASGQTNLGFMYSRGTGVEKDAVQAVFWYRKAAEQGDASAQTNLGFMYSRGTGVEKDAVQAVTWYRKAAEQGNANGQTNLAFMYSKGTGVEKDAVQAVFWYRKAAEQGYATAQYNLGFMYEEGAGVEKDAVQAAYWYRKAAEQGDADGQNNLAVMYRDGKGVEADLSEALRLWRLAAPKNDYAFKHLLTHMTIQEALHELDKDSGSSDSRRVVVKIMYLGDALLTPLAIRTAHTYLTSKAYQELDPASKKDTLARLREVIAEIQVPKLSIDDAAELEALFNLGVTEAAFLLGDIHAKSKGGMDDKKATFWYHEAAKQGHATAQNNLGAHYADGIGVNKDDVQAVYWYRKAADQGYVIAQRQLGWSYEFSIGTGVKMDDVQASYWYRKAADQGDAFAQCALGRLYQNSASVGKDDTQAVYWYRKAADQGDADAQSRLASLETEIKASGDAGRVAALSASITTLATPKSSSLNEGGSRSTKGANFVDRNQALLQDLQNQAMRLSAEGKFLEAAKVQQDISKLHLVAKDVDASLTASLVELLLIEKHSERRYGSPDNYFHLIFSSCLWGKAAREAQTLKRPEFALFLAKRSVNLLQQARRELAQLDNETRECFLKAHEDRYRWLADLMVDMGRLGEAEQVLAMLKHFEVEEYLRSGKQHASASVEMQLDTRQRSVQQTIDGYSAQIQAAATVQRLRSLRRTLTADESSQLDTAKTTLKQAGQRFNEGMATVVQDLRSLRQPGTEESSREGAALAATSIQGTLSKAFKGRAVVLQAVVLPHRMHWLFISAQTQQVVQIPVDREALSRKVAAFRSAVQSTKVDPRPLARELYDLLIAPVEPLLHEEGVDTLMISADDVLRYLPFAALYDGKQYLIERFALSTYNPALRDMLIAQDQPDWKVAAFGVAKGGAGFSELPNITKELRAVVQEKDSPNGALPGIARLDPQFTKAEFSKALDEHYPLIHVASHFGLAFGDRKQSVLLLGGGVTLPLSDLEDKIEFDFSGVELLTLSACETAVPVGQLSATGSEVDSLGSVIQRAGARSVLASLWKVDDSATAALMRSFYLQLAEKSNTGKAKSLQLAQLTLLSGEEKGDGKKAKVGRGFGRGDQSDQAEVFIPDPNAPFAHPFYWAPFTLMGNWL